MATKRETRTVSFTPEHSTFVDELVESGLLRRLLAMTEILFSNSLIEAWWRVLKHQWLFLHQLDSVAKGER